MTDVEIIANALYYYTESWFGRLFQSAQKAKEGKITPKELNAIMALTDRISTLHLAWQEKRRNELQ